MGRSRTLVAGLGAAMALGGAAVVAQVVGATENPPVIAAVEPNKGSVDGGARIEIVGSAFKAPLSVEFGAATAEGVEIVNTTHLFVKSPPHYAGTFIVQVITNAGSSELKCNPEKGGFGGRCKGNEYRFLGLKTVELIPNHGPVSGGTVVHVIGDGFGPPTSFLFGKGGASEVECVSLTECIVTTPAAKKPGSAVVKAVNDKKDKTKKSESAVFKYE
jgi:hypothetical protein